MSTPHNMANIGDIAKVVLMPGDPLRARHIAETFLDDVVQFNNIRNMFGYTGTYKGKKISVMGSGMGMPSIGIYSFELFSQYGVEAIIRIGSAGSYREDYEIYDVVLASGAYSESNYAKVLTGNDSCVTYPSNELNELIKNTADELDLDLKEGVIHSSDIFYHIDGAYKKGIEDNNCVAVEMESFALFENARALNKKAACLLTISDSLITHEETTAEERQTSFNKMITIALESAIKL
ncbi:MAG: purine-nucleoside phosphorylase [Erysipelotrichaceae bacterium]